MKVFVVYVSAGAGHRKAAEAVYEYLKKTRPDLQLRFIDILDYANPIFKLLYSKGYIFLISKLPWLWYFLYSASFIWPKNTFRIYSDFLNLLPFVNLIKTENPEVIVSTHFITSSVLSIAKEKKLIDTRLITIITDYNLHPFWVGKGVDLYVASCGFVKDALVKAGVTESKIKVYGIPVNMRFYELQKREELALKLGVGACDFTALIITGAIGIGPIEQIVKALTGKVQMLVVCGNNKKLYNHLSDLKPDGVKVYPLVGNVDELMSISDIVLTKAGGLTISESLVKFLPMIFFSSIPGLETANAQVIVNSGAGFKAGSIEDIVKILHFLKAQPTVYNKAQDSIKLLRNADTLLSISSEIAKL